MNVGLIGCGVVGSQIALAISKHQDENLDLLSVFDRHISKAQLVSKETGAAVFDSPRTMIRDKRIDLIIEAASHDAVRRFGQEILQARKDFMILSTGALLDDSFLARLSDSATQNRVRMILPSGAAFGVDFLKAARIAGATKVKIELHRSNEDLEKLRVNNQVRRKIINKKRGFDHWMTAREFVSLVPKISNFIATISLAGVGPERTFVRIRSVSGIKSRMTRISVSTDSWRTFAVSTTKLEQVGLGSPTISSVLSKLLELKSPVHIGT